MSSIQDKLRTEVESAREKKRRCLEEVHKAKETIKSLQEQIPLFEQQASDAQEELDFAEHRLGLLSSSKPITVIEPYPKCKNRGYLGLLGDDLKGQTSVSRMRLELRLGPDESIESLQSLIQYIESNQELHRIELFHEEGKFDKPCDTLTHMPDLFLKAIASNANIRDVMLRVYPTAQVLCGFMPATHCCYTFRIQNFNNVYPCAKDRQMIVSHLFTMSLSTTQLCVLDRGRVLNGVVDLFFHWNPRKGGDCTILCHFPEKMVATLAKSLQSMTQLVTLELHCINFGEAKWDSLFPSLNLSSGLKHFSLFECVFDSTARNGYTKLLQTKPSLQKAAIEYFYQMCDSVDDHMSGSFGELWTSILTNLPMGSNLQELSLDVFASNSLDMFLDTLVSLGPSIPLSKLTLKRIYPTERLAKYVQKLSSIRELCLGCDGTIAESIFTELQQNESLHHVRIYSCKAQSEFYPKSIKRVEACCERNRYLSSLLLYPATTTESSSSPFNQMLLPLAFSAARQVKLTGLYKILNSLKYCGDMIGPHQQGLVAR